MKFRENGVRQARSRDPARSRLRLGAAAPVQFADIELPNNLEYTIALAQDAKQLGMKFLLNYHYRTTGPTRRSSPFRRPGKEIACELVTAVFEYTRDTIAAFRDAGVLPDMVQIGNEVINGMMWPDGKLPENWDHFAALIYAGINGVDAGRGNDPRPEIMIHIDRGGDLRRPRGLLRQAQFLPHSLRLIGQSYYPWWHGSLNDLRANLEFMARAYRRTSSSSRPPITGSPSEEAYKTSRDRSRKLPKASGSSSTR